MISAESLVNPDPDGELDKFLSHFLPLYDACIHGDPQSWQSARLNSAAGHKTAVGIDVPKYPAPPAPRLNTLYWPTGASRWARGYFLVTGDNLSGAANSPITFHFINTGPGGSWDCNLYALSPRPISGLGGTTSRDLWLVPVVDGRYYWQFLDTGEMTCAPGTTWSTVLSYLGTRLGVTIVGSAPNAAYGVPDPEELSRKYLNAAVLLDAVAHSLGARIVRSPSTGIVSLMTFGESLIYHALNAATAAPGVIAGGTIGLGAAPQYVTTVFRKYKDHRPYGDGSTYSVSNAQSATTMPIMAGTRKVVLSTCYANFTAGSGTPDNGAALNSLAAKIAADYFLSLTQRHDFTVWGHMPWNPTAFDDHILWAFAAPGVFEHQVQTRVQSTPYNLGVEEMLQQDLTLQVISSPAGGYLVDSLSFEGQATFAVCRRAGGSPFDTGLRIEVHDTLLNAGDDPLASLTRMQVHWSDDDNCWLDGPANCEAEGIGNLPT